MRLGPSTESLPDNVNAVKKTKQTSKQTKNKTKLIVDEVFNSSGKLLTVYYSSLVYRDIKLPSIYADAHIQVLTQP